MSRAAGHRRQPDVLRPDQGDHRPPARRARKERDGRPEDGHPIAVGRTRDPVGEADELGHEARLRSVVELRRSGDLLEAAGRHDADPIAHRQGLLLVVGDEEGRDPDHDLDPPDLLAELATDLGVEGRQRLVEQEHLRLDGQRPGERDSLLLAAGHLVRVATGLAGRGRRGRASRRLAASAPRCRPRAAAGRSRRCRERSCSGRGCRPGRRSPCSACSRPRG